MDPDIDLKFLKYISNDHIIYKNGEPVSGHCYGNWRVFHIRKQKQENKLYQVDIYKLGSNGQVRDKIIASLQMELVTQKNSQIQFSNQDDSLLIRLHNNAVNEIIWKRFQYCTDTLYIKAPTKELEQMINIPFSLHLTDLNAPANKTDRDGLIERYYTIVKDMEIHGQASQAKARYYLFLGKVQLSRGACREAREALTLCIMTLLFNNFPPNHEAIYWFGKVYEAEGNLTAAKSCYDLALKRYTDHPGGIRREEIIQALNSIQVRPS